MNWLLFDRYNRSSKSAAFSPPPEAINKSFCLSLLKSAIANAENNHEMKAENLYVAEIYANQGPTLKRIRPAAKGSAVRIRKRTSHITIVLKERD